MNRAMLTLQLLAPAAFPRFVRNTDLHQNSQLLRLPELVTGDRRLRCLPADPRLGVAGVLGPLALERLATGPASRVLPAVGKRLGAFLDGRVVAGRPDRRTDVLLGHGLLPFGAGRSGPPILWGPGYVNPDFFRDTGPDVQRALQQRDGTLAARAKHVGGVFLTTADAVTRYRARIGIPAADVVFAIPYLMAKAPRSDALEVPDKPTRGPLRLAFVGAEARRKNLPTVIAALDRLRASRHFTLTVVSDLRDGPVDLARDYIQHHQRLPNTEVQQLMRGSHLFVMPSLQESFGLVFVEALMGGCAVLAPDRAAQRDILGPLGHYVEPTDVDDVCARLDALLGQPPSQDAAALAVDRYRQRFAPDVVANAFYDAAAAVRDAAVC